MFVWMRTLVAATFPASSAVLAVSKCNYISLNCLPWFCLRFFVSLSRKFLTLYFITAIAWLAVALPWVHLDVSSKIMVRSYLFIFLFDMSLASIRLRSCPLSISEVGEKSYMIAA